MYLVHKFVCAQFCTRAFILAPFPGPAPPRPAFRMVKQATESWAGPGKEAMFISMSIFRYRGKIPVHDFLRREEGGSHEE